MELLKEHENWNSYDIFPILQEKLKQLSDTYEKPDIKTNEGFVLSLGPL